MTDSTTTWHSPEEVGLLLVLAVQGHRSSGVARHTNDDLVQVQVNVGEANAVDEQLVSELFMWKLVFFLFL